MPRLSFDWRRFCDGHKIEYVTSGRNVSSGHMAIKCPFCGEADPSQHMVLSLASHKPYWGCWRNRQHKGFHPAFLVAKLLHISSKAAEALVTGEREVYDDEWQNLVARVTIGRKLAAPEPRPVTITMPRFCEPIRDDEFHDPFLDYLEDRGFKNPVKVAKDFDLHCALMGDYCFRIIFPIYHQDHLVNLVGRDITGNAKLRYKAAGKHEAGRPLDECLFNYDEAICGGEFLWICEGPFDALKILTYANTRHTAIAMFGMPKRQQIVMLAELSRRFKHTLLALDHDAVSQALTLWPEFLGDTRTVWLPRGRKDVGELSPSEVRQLTNDRQNRLTHS